MQFNLTVYVLGFLKGEKKMIRQVEILKKEKFFSKLDYGKRFHNSCQGVFLS